MYWEVLLVDNLPITLFLGIACLLCLYRYSTQNFDYWKKIGIPQAGPAIPFFGTLYPMLWKPVHEIDLERYRKFGALYGQYEGNRPALMVADPKLIREILVKEFSTFENHPVSSFTSSDAVVSSFLFFLTGEEWRRKRTLVSPAFSTGKIKKMINHLKLCCRAEMESLKKAAKNGKAIKLKQFTDALIMDIIASAAFSVHLDSYNDTKNVFVQSAVKTFSPYLNFKLAFYQMCPKLAKMAGVEIIASKPLYFFKEAALNIMIQRKKTGHTRHDFLQCLMGTVKEFSEEKEVDVRNEETNSKSPDEPDKRTTYQIKKCLSPDEAISQVIQFFLAGFDTVSLTITHAAYLLALHPDIQNRAYEEVRDVLLKTEGDLTHEALQEMSYLENVVSETQRLYPSFPRLGREAGADYKLGDTDVIIPKGTTFFIPVYSIHRDPRFYPDPDKFDPDRFLPEERAKRNPYTYLPFGTGPRICIGMRFALMEIKTCLTYLLANFEIHTCPETKVPLKFGLGPGLSISKPQMLRFEERTEKIPLK